MVTDTPLPERPRTAGPTPTPGDFGACRPPRLTAGLVSDSIARAPMVLPAGLRGRVLQLNFTHTWGDQWYLGLTGIEVLDTGLWPIEG